MRFLLSVFSLCLGLCPQDPLPVPAAQTYAPSAVPDRILLTWAEDPATTQSVTWRTDLSVSQPIAEIAVAGADSQFTASAKRVSATSTQLETDLGEALYHSVTFRELSPKTKYAYRVGDGVNWSEWSHFTTASDTPEPFSFIYFGDAQNDVKSHWSRVVREAFAGAPRAALLLHAGDLVNLANSDAEWGEWFYSAGWIMRTMPSIATPGNHEYASVRGPERRRRVLSAHWQPQFELPRNGPSGYEETVYFMDYQGVRFISLNTNVDLDPQVQWFEEMMKTSESRWTVVTMHHPVFSTAQGRDNPQLRHTLQPLFDKHEIDIVLQGHDHTYGRTARVRYAGEPPQRGYSRGRRGGTNVPIGLMARSEESGTVYVVSVSGPKMYDLDRKPLMVKATQNTQLYQVISIDGSELVYSAYTATGELFDRFMLRKAEGKPNELIESSGR